MTDPTPRVEVDAGEVLAVAVEEALHVSPPVSDAEMVVAQIDALLAHASPSPDGRRRVVLEERDGGVEVMGLEQHGHWCGAANAPTSEGCCTATFPTYCLVPPVPATEVNGAD